MTKNLSTLSLAVMVCCVGTSAQASSTWTTAFDGCAGFDQAQTSMTYAASTADCTSSAAAGPLDKAIGIGTNTYDAGSEFVARDIDHWSGGGLGVEPLGSSEGSPNHSVDNYNWIDAVVLKFDSSVILNEVTLGWRKSDWDFSLFRYTGTGDALSSSFYTDGMTGLKLPTAPGTSLAAGWQLVTNYAASGGCSTPCEADIKIEGLNDANLSASWWLVSAYSSTYGTGSLAGGDAHSLGEGTRDYFKLLSVAGKTPDTPTSPSETPEPGSLVLAAAALAGLGFTRRRMTKV